MTPPYAQTLSPFPSLISPEMWRSHSAACGGPQPKMLMLLQFFTDYRKSFIADRGPDVLRMTNELCPHHTPALESEGL